MPYPMDPREEVKVLKAEAEAINHELNEINSRISELEKEKFE
jgi:hypothetical protein